MPGAKQGMHEKEPTIAGLLMFHRYATAQFGKNHLSEVNEMLSANHEFTYIERQ